MYIIYLISMYHLSPLLFFQDSIHHCCQLSLVNVYSLRTPYENTQLRINKLFINVFSYGGTPTFYFSVIYFIFILKIKLNYYFIMFNFYPNMIYDTAHIVRMYRINKAYRFH